MSTSQQHPQQELDRPLPQQQQQASSTSFEGGDLNGIPQDLQQHATTIICRGNLPKAAVEDLKTWLFQHFHYPYPNDAEKDRLMAQTGLTLTQVNNWFINARRRIWKPIIQRRQGDHKRHQQLTSSVTAGGPASPGVIPPIGVMNTSGISIPPAITTTPAPTSPFFPQQPLTHFPTASPLPTSVNQMTIPKNSRQEDHQKSDSQTNTTRVNANVMRVESMSGVDVSMFEEYLKSPLDDQKTGRKRSYEETFIDENYNEMLDEYNRLTKENNGLKAELKRLTTNYQNLSHDMAKRQQLLAAKLTEMEQMQNALEAENRNLTNRLHERKRAKLSLPKPMALRPSYEKKKDGTEGVFKPLTRTFTQVPRFKSLETPVALLSFVQSQNSLSSSDAASILQQ